jgi:hypothetical protein
MGDFQGRSVNLLEGMSRTVPNCCFLLAIASCQEVVDQLQQEAHRTEYARWVCRCGVAYLATLVCLVGVFLNCFIIFRRGNRPELGNPEGIQKNWGLNGGTPKSSILDWDIPL